MYFYFANQDQVRYSDVIYTIFITFSKHSREETQLEIECLGTNTLKDLCEKIYCTNNFIQNDFGLNFDEFIFLIEDTIYMKDQFTSTSNENTFNYLENLGFQENSSIPATLDIKFDDLPFKLGKKYKYFHKYKGSCEHNVYISDIRASNIHFDHFPRANYPIIKFQSKMAHKRCGICEFNCGKFIVFGDRLCVDIPTLFCSTCYDFLHLSSDGELIYGDFLSFPYFRDII